MQNYYRIFSGSVLVLIMIAMSIAQNPIPNPGFENWTDENPDGWLTINTPGFYVPITQSDISHSGASALKGEVVDYFGYGWPPYMISDTTGGGFSVSQNYTRMTGYYQFTNMGQDVMEVVAWLVDAQGLGIASGAAELGATTGGYTPFTVDLIYYPGEEPAALAYIIFSIIPASEATVDTVTLGSYFLIDDLAFDLVNAIDELSGVNTVDNFVLEQNYPNPFNPSTKISFSLPQAEFVNLTVFNSLGQEVQQLVNTALPAGNHTVTFDAADFPSGIYFYRIKAGQYSDLKKMVLIK